MRIFEYVARHARAILFVIVMFAASGVALMLNLPVSLFPDITFPRIVILADNGEEPAERMMVEVTKPLEEAASSLPNLNLVRSITSRGSTEISLGLDWGGDVRLSLLQLQGRIDNVRSTMPPSVVVRAEQMQVSVFPILGYSLSSNTLSLVELRDIALYQIRPALMRVNGVAAVTVEGGETREFLVTVSPEKLSAYHLDIRAVADAIRKANKVTSSGLVDNNDHLYLSLVSGLYTKIDDISSTVVAVRNGVPIRVNDLAEVRPSVADRFIRTTAHGREAVLINVLKQQAGSTVKIGSDAITAITKLKLPHGVRLENFYDQGSFIQSSINTTRDSIVLGVLLAMLVLLFFLRSWRVTIVVALVVPTTIMATFACLYAVGKTINIMTLGGIAAAVGLIIDDAIVVIENIFAHIASGKRDPGLGVTAGSVGELMPAILGSTASTIVIHIPLAFLGGVTGAFFASLSVTMVFAMSLSFLFSITLAPLLATYVLRDKDVTHELRREDHRSSVARWYERTMPGLLKVRGVFIPVALLIVAATYYLYNNIGSDFMPEMDEGAFVLDYASPPGTSLTETNRMLTEIEKELLSIPEVDSYARRTGTQMGFFLTEPNTGDYMVKLKSERTRSIEDVIEEVREKVNSAEPSLRIEFGQLMMDVIGDLTNNPSPIEIKLFGSDVKILQTEAEKVSSLISTLPGVVDVFDGIVISGPSLVVHVDPLKSSLAGLNPSDVREQLETMIRGERESGIQRGEKLIGIRVRYPDAYRLDISSIEEAKMISESGKAVPLRSIAGIERTSGQSEIHREGLRPLVAVTARISGRDLGRTIDDIKERLGRELSLPPGVTLIYGGIYQTQQESFRGLLLVALAALTLVFIVLLFEFGEFAVPVSIFIINILSLFGVFAALWLTGVTFNISSFVGIIMIIGIVAENAIFVMHRFKSLRADGIALDTALINASIMRARPIAMTTLAAILALLPLSLGIGAGGQMQQPLAIAVIGGFTLSSILLFFGLPMVYRLIGGAGK